MSGYRGDRYGGGGDRRDRDSDRSSGGGRYGGGGSSYSSRDRYSDRSDRGNNRDRSRDRGDRDSDRSRHSDRPAHSSSSRYGGASDSPPSARRFDSAMADRRSSSQNGDSGPAQNDADEPVSTSTWDAAKEAENDPTWARIYVSNLPSDITSDELQEMFGAIGVVAREKQKRGYKDQWPFKIKVYTDDNGVVKGDAVITYEDANAARTAPSFFNGEWLSTCLCSWLYVYLEVSILTLSLSRFQVRRSAVRPSRWSWQASPSRPLVAGQADQVVVAVMVAAAEVVVEAAVDTEAAVAIDTAEAVVEAIDMAEEVAAVDTVGVEIAAIAHTKRVLF